MKYLKFGLAAFSGALLGAVGGGLAVYRLFEHWGDKAPVEAGKIQVTELTLVDGQKRPAARLSLDGDGFVVLEFLRLDSQKAVELKASRSGGYESLQFGPFDGGPGQMFLSASSYGTSLFLGDSYRGPKLTLGALEAGDVGGGEPADSWGVVFGTTDRGFKQPDPHYPKWVRERPRGKP